MSKLVNKQQLANILPMPAPIAEQTNVAYVSYFNNRLFLISKDLKLIARREIQYEYQSLCPCYLSLTFCQNKIFLPNCGIDNVSVLDGIIPQEFDQLKGNIDTLVLFTIDNKIYYTSAYLEDFVNYTYELCYENKDNKLFLKEEKKIDKLLSSKDDRYNNFHTVPNVLIRSNMKTIAKITIMPDKTFKEEKLLDFISDQNPVSLSGILLYWGSGANEKEFVVINCLGSFKVHQKSDFQQFPKDDNSNPAEPHSGLDQAHVFAELGEFGWKFPNEMISKFGFSDDEMEKCYQIQREFLEKQIFKFMNKEQIIKQINEIIEKDDEVDDDDQ